MTTGVESFPLTFNRSTSERPSAPSKSWCDLQRAVGHTAENPRRRNPGQYPEPDVSGTRADKRAGVTIVIGDTRPSTLSSIQRECHRERGRSRLICPMRARVRRVVRHTFCLTTATQVRTVLNSSPEGPRILSRGERESYSATGDT